MRRVYIVGGGPAAGKSTIAQALSRKYKFDYLKADDLVGEHQQEAAERKFPVNNYINSLPEDKQQLELIRLSGQQEIARQKELFFILLKELRKRQFSNLILEGNCLFPKLLIKYFEHDYIGVWLVPTYQFQKKIYPERSWVPKLLKQSDDPDLVLKNWLYRDREFNKEVLRQVKEYELSAIRINGKRSISDTQAWVEEKFNLLSA